MPVMRKPRFALLALVVLLLVAGCQQRFDGTRLTITTGSPGAVYDQLGATLAGYWAAQLGVQTNVENSAGSVQNLDRLLSGQADLAISAADAAADRYGQSDGRQLRALARIHDDYVQVVVPANSNVYSLAQLRGLRVSVGPEGSQVRLVADRLLAQVGLGGPNDVQRSELSIDQDPDALCSGRINAFFWSGGIPTGQVADLAGTMPIRLIDLSDVAAAVTKRWPVYEAVTVPASTYQLPAPVTILTVPNYLLATDRMPDALAQSLTADVFGAQSTLAATNRAARSIDVRSGIETIPIPLHPGALAYYRSAHFVS
jgi:uncharacterized protein